MRIARLLVITLMVVVGLPTVPSADAETTFTSSTTMLGGTARYDAGEWAYQDFVWDDYGADTIPAGSAQRVTLAATRGDFRYPDDPRYAGNAADIAEVRAALSGDDLALEITLNTLVDETVPALGIAIDTGGGEVREWPFGAGVRSAWDVFVFVDGDSATVATTGVGADPAHSLSVDTTANAISFVVPGVATGASLDIAVGAGLAGDSSFMAGSPLGLLPDTFNSGGPSFVRIFDLAFNTRELEPRGGAWQEDAQARALLLGDVSEFSQTIDLDRLRSLATDDPIAPEGFSNRIFHSRQDLGEGAAAEFPQYRTTRNPYGLWIPEGYDPSTPTPLILNLHSLSVHHNQYRGGDGATSYFTMHEQLGDGLGAIVATPLARGPDGWYEDEALIDTLEVLADVQAAYNVDPDRIYLSGYSMGGYGTYRLGTLMADRFAAAVSWAGVPTNTDRLENMHSVPTMIVHGTNDELVPITGVREQAARFDELGYTYRFHEHPGIDHFLLVWLDEWSRTREWFDGRTRVDSPPVVHLKVQPSTWTETDDPVKQAEILGHIDALGAEFDSAYWVRDVVVRDPSGTGEVVAEAGLSGTGSSTPIDTVALGPPTPHLTKGLDAARSTSRDGFRLTTSLVDDMTIDVERAGIDTSADFPVVVDVDAPVTLRLEGPFADATVEDFNGRPISWTYTDGALVIEVEFDTTFTVVV